METIKKVTIKSNIAVLDQEIDSLKAVNEDLQAKIIELESISDLEQRSQEVRDFADQYNWSCYIINAL